MQVDPVEQRTADACAVTLDLRGRATAFVPQVAQIAARAGIHRRDEYEGAGQGDLAGAARDRDLAVFKGTAISGTSSLERTKLGCALRGSVNRGGVAGSTPRLLRVQINARTVPPAKNFGKMRLGSGSRYPWVTIWSISRDSRWA